MERFRNKKGHFVKKSTFKKAANCFKIRQPTGQITLDDALSLLECSDAENSCTATNLDSNIDTVNNETLSLSGAGDCSTSTSTISTTGDIQKPIFMDLEGTRIIDVKHLAVQLDNGCFLCGNGLLLTKCVKETRRGLASVFHIYCINCEEINRVSTSKTHSVAESKDGRSSSAYDLNTKAAAGKWTT